MKITFAKCLLMVVISLAAYDTIQAQNWPKEIASSQGKLLLYQPQPQSLDGIQCTGIAAFSVTPTGKKDPVFGALFFDAKLNIDRDDRTYEVESFQIPNIKFSGEQSEIDVDKIKQAILSEVPKWQLQGSVDELISTVEEYTGQQSKGAEQFKNDPPKIVYASTPSMLIMIDGEPVMKDIENSSLRYVANSPYVILQDKTSRKYYLYGGEIWYETTDIKGVWKTTKNIPKDIITLMEKNKDQAAKVQKVEVKPGDTPPQIIVATQPTELIQTKGEPNYIPVKGSSNLLYAKNTEDNIFKEISSNNYYILKSGRWYASKSLEGPWQFTPADKIPGDFAKIESGSEKDVVRASVPGTVEAQDAILDAQVPQTATVDRKTAGKALEVKYDGAPRFSQIEGTSLLQLAENANKTVIKSGSKYYCVDNAVWYESNNYNGPWEVSTERPADVENIPASSSAYNTKYVQIYDSTPDVVYVGYTPGYMGSYIYGPTIVYGTGWYYPPYMGSWYYPHHCTWGFNMNYNPWTGWSFGFGFTTGPYHFGFGTGGFSFGMSFGWGMGYPPYYGYGGGWFGPPMYRPPCFPPAYPWYGYNRPGYRPPANIGNGGNINWGGGNQINIGGDVNINVGSGNKVNALNKGNENLYARDSKVNGNKGISTGMKNVDPGKLAGTGRPGQKPVNPPAAGNQAGRPTTGTRPAIPSTPKQPNNVYADRNGNVYRKDNQGNWQQNNGKNWTNMGAATGKSGQPSTRPAAPTTNNRAPSINTSDYNRNRSTQRASSYNRASAPATRPMGGGGRRGR